MPTDVIPQLNGSRPALIESDEGADDLSAQEIPRTIVHQDGVCALLPRVPIHYNHSRTPLAVYLTKAAASLTDVDPVNSLSTQRPQEVCAKI